MILIPAIDIKGGKVVRLFQGKFTDMKKYDDDPVAVALKWESQGAQWLHVVDLDGAQTGTMKNQATLGRIVRAIKIPVQFGGGIRGEATIDYLLSIVNVNRIILGTKAVESPDFLKSVLKKWQERIVVSLDCSNGFVTGHGWASTTNLKAQDFAKQLQDLGLQWLVYTDIARDGTLAGPNYDGIQSMLDVLKIPLIASGGIATLEDVKKLAAMKGVAAAITGKAIYEGTLDFKKALDACSTNA